MRKTFLTVCVAAIVLTSCDSKEKSADTASTTNEAKTDKKEWIPIDSAMMNKAWAESMTVGEPHKMLAKSAGTWDGEVTMWFEANGQPVPSKTTATTTTLYNGLYQHSVHKGDMMGMPFEGMSTTGYDNVKKEYFSTWIDNMGSGILLMTGQWDEASKSIMMTGKMKNPANGLDCEMKEKFTIVDSNHHTMEMWGPDPKTGEPYKNMEIKYTRRN